MPIEDRRDVHIMISIAVSCGTARANAFDRSATAFASRFLPPCLRSRSGMAVARDERWGRGRHNEVMAAPYEGRART